MIIRTKINDSVPFGWRLPSLKELGIYRDSAKKVMEEKSKVRIGEGWAFFGSYYGHQIKMEDVSEEQLLIREHRKLAYSLQ